MQILNDFGWNSCSNTVCWDVVCDYAIGSYNDSIANGYSWQNADVVGQPHIITYHNSTFGFCFAQGGRDEQGGIVRISMAVVCYQYISACKQVVANGDTLDGCKMVVATYHALTANDDAWLFAPDFPGCELQAAFKNVAITDADIFCTF